MLMRPCFRGIKTGEEICCQTTNTKVGTKIKYVGTYTIKVTGGLWASLELGSRFPPQVAPKSLNLGRIVKVRCTSLPSRQSKEQMDK